MSTVTVSLDDDVVALLHGLNQPVQQTVREMIVLELYRQHRISSGKAAELLGISRDQLRYRLKKLEEPSFAAASEAHSP